MKKQLKITIIAVSAAILILAGVIASVSISVHRNSPEYTLSLAERYLTDLDYEQAIVYFEKYLKIEPRDVDVWLDYAYAYEKTGDIDKAMETLERALEFVDDDRIREKREDIAVLEILPAPTGITCVSGANSVMLQWKAVSGASFYKVVLYNTETKRYEKNVMTSDLEIKIRNLKASTEYLVKITTMSIKNGSVCENETTDAISFTTKEEMKLPAPSNIRYDADDHSVTLWWDKVSGASFYNVVLYNAKTQKYEKNLTTSDLEIQIRNLKAFTEYFVKITSISIKNGSVCKGETTDAISFRTKGVMKLPAPLNVRCDSDDHSVTLKWDKVPGADAYKVWIRNNITDEFEINTVGADNTCYVDGLNDNTKYDFKITTITTVNGLKEHDTTDVISCITKEKKKKLLQYVDASTYFKTSDILYGVADGKVVNVQGTTEWDEPKKSVYVSDSLKCTKLDKIFPYGLYYTEPHKLVPWETPELVHNSGMKYVYKATANGAKIIKKSKYPMYVTQDGYIAYYESRNSNYVVVNIESQTGETISSTTIYDYTEPMGAPYGGVIDRLADMTWQLIPYSCDLKGAQFTYFLDSEQVYNSKTGYYDKLYSRYLFYNSGKVVLDKGVSVGDVDSYSDNVHCPDKLTHSGDTYLYGQVEEAFDNNIVIAEYYHSSFNPWEYLDFYVDPAYAAYALINTETGKVSKLYKSIESADGKLFLATDFNGKKYYINSSGKKLADGYDDAGPFIGDYSYIYKNGCYYIIDRKMNVVTEVDGTNVYVLGSNRFSCVKGNKVYLFEVNQ